MYLCTNNHRFHWQNYTVWGVSIIAWHLPNHWTFSTSGFCLRCFVIATFCGTNVILMSKCSLVLLELCTIPTARFCCPSWNCDASPCFNLRVHKQRRPHLLLFSLYRVRRHCEVCSHIGTTVLQKWWQLLMKSNTGAQVPGATGYVQHTQVQKILN